MRTAWLVFLLSLSAAAQPRVDDRRIDELLAKVTLEEKLGQLRQYVPDQAQLEEELVARDARWGRIAEGAGEDPA